MYSIHSHFKTAESIVTGNENFAAWKSATESLLQVKDLWGCIAGDPQYTENKYKDRQARELIISSIQPVMYRHIQNTKTAKEAWDELLSVFGDSGLAGKIKVLSGTVPKWNQLVSFFSIEEYVEVKISSFLALREMGLHITEEWIGVQLLAGLTKDYWPLVVELDTARATITGSVVKKELLEFYVKNFRSPTFCEISPVYVDPEEENDGQSLTTSSGVSVSSGQEQAYINATWPTLAEDLRTWYENLGETAYLPESSRQYALTSGPSNATQLPPCSSIKKSDLEVEVRGQYGEYYQGFVTDVFEGEVEVSFDHKRQRTSRFPFSDVRLPSKVNPIQVVRMEQEVEVYTRVNASSPYGWWTARIDMSGSSGTVIVRMSTWVGSRFGHVECAGRDRLRTPNGNPPIDSDTFHKREISVPEEQRESAAQANIHKDFQRAIGAALCRYVPEKGVLLVISRNENLRSLSSWFEDFQARQAEESACFLRYSRLSTGTDPLLSNDV